MNDATSEPRTCGVCGDPIRPDNQEGICSRTPECQRRRMAAKRAAAAQPAEQRNCKICGEPLRSMNRTGICNSRKRRECRLAARRELRQDKTLQAYRITISAGDRFGLWTALEDYTVGSKTVSCRCDCGRERRIRGTALTGGGSQGCGCTRRGAVPGRELYMQAGSVFGRLTVLEDVTYNNEQVRCLCSCGRETTVIATSVKLGLTRSCSCLQRETRIKHGFTGHPLAQTWRGMIRRCTDPRDPAYYNYGGRGIEVCERWMDPWVFAEDLYREIGPRPEGVNENGRSLYSLDRWPDNDGNYEPGNVRWGTQSEQVMNQRKVSALTQDVLRLTRERDALAAELAALRAAS